MKRIRRRRLAVVCAALLTTAAQTVEFEKLPGAAGVYSLVVASVSAQTDPFAPVRFLLGEWTAIDTPAGETGAFAFRLAVQDRVIVRTNEANYAATADRPASRHEDLLIVYSENGSLKADYFDNEGHVIRYSVATGAANTAVFTSEPNPREPRYRLTYRVGADGILNGSFEVAAPGTPEAFKPYLSWKARKVQPGNRIE